jgi:hypothetical protein
VPLLHTLNTPEEPLALVFPRPRPLHMHASRMQRGVAHPVASALRPLAIAGRLGEVGEQACIAHARAIMRGIKASLVESLPLLR